MSLMKRKRIRKNTTIISVVMQLLVGLLIGGYAYAIGKSLKSMVFWISIFVVMSLFIGVSTWVHETEKLGL